MSLSASDFSESLFLIERSPYIAIDTEGTGIDGIRDGRDWSYGVSVGGRNPDDNWSLWSRYFPFRHAEEDKNLPPKFQEALFAAFDKRTKKNPAIMHNRQYDHPALLTLGHEFKGYWFDTPTMIHLVNPNWPKGLDRFTTEIMKIEGKRKSPEWQMYFDFWEKQGKGLGWRNGYKFPVHVMGDYATGDVELTIQVFEWLWPYFVEMGYWN